MQFPSNFPFSNWENPLPLLEWEREIEMSKNVNNSYAADSRKSHNLRHRY